MCAVNLFRSKLRKQICRHLSQSATTTIMSLMSLNLEGPIWMLLAMPVLLLASPRLIKYAVTIILNFRKRQEKQTLKAEISDYKKQLSGISQVNEFAKYSKIQRKLRATSDKLNSIGLEEIELNVKYVLVAQALAWLLAIIFCFRLLHLLYSSTAEYVMDVFFPVDTHSKEST